MNTNFNPLPSLNQQFVNDHFEPVRKTVAVNMAEAFELAKEQYEIKHGHQFPHSYDTFRRKFYGR